MTACVALAWTSPELVIIDIDRSQYRPYIARDTTDRRDLELVLAAQDPRPVVVLATSVSILARISDLPVKAFIVFDTVTVLRTLVGAVALDFDMNGNDIVAIRRIKIDDVHAAIETSQPFSVPEDAVRVSSTLASKITLSELMQKVERKAPNIVDAAFISFTCERLVGRIGKAAWVARVRKPAIAAGIDTQMLAELERFIEDGSVSDGLWRGFYALIEEGKAIELVEKTHDVRRTDLDYLCSVLGSSPIGEDKYASAPTKSKKRK